MEYKSILLINLCAMQPVHGIPKLLEPAKANNLLEMQLQSILFAFWLANIVFSLWWI